MTDSQARGGRGDSHEHSTEPHSAVRLPLLLDRWSGRSRRVLSDGAWSTLRTLASVAGSGPLLGLPAQRRVLLLAPHPDDETIGCGGTASLLVRAGSTVQTVVVTDGTGTPGTGLPVEEVARRRRAEAKAACRCLYLDAPVHLGLQDGSVSDHLPALTRLLSEHVERLQPGLVLAPWAGEGHPDHRAVLTALVAVPDLRATVWGYETWTPVPWPNRVVDVSAVTSEKARAIEQHHTAALSMDVSAMLALDRYRSLHGLAGRGHAEAFLALTPAGHRGLLEAIAGRLPEGIR